MVKTDGDDEHMRAVIIYVSICFMVPGFDGWYTSLSPVDENQDQQLLIRAPFPTAA